MIDDLTRFGFNFTVYDRLYSKKNKQKTKLIFLFKFYMSSDYEFQVLDIKLLKMFFPR